MKTGTIYNILGVYSLRDQTDASEGLRAYKMYNETMRLFAHAYFTDVYAVSGIFAALSPMNDYKGNLRSLKTVLEAKKAKLLDCPDRFTVTTTNPNKRKAIEIAKGSAPIVVFKTANKVRNFYVNISNPNDRYAVTIDRHMIGVWQGFRDKEGRVPDYDIVANDFRKAANMVSVLPNQLQACCWFVWKRIHSIVYDPQQDLFQMPDNIWRSITKPDDIEAFPFRKLGEKSKHVSGSQKRRNKRTPSKEEKNMILDSVFKETS
jgi:hypothetical protein